MMLELNGGCWNINNIVCFGHLKNIVKGFKNINYSVKYSLQNWILYHTHFIKSPISNNYIKTKLDGVNGGANTELCQIVIIQVSVPELHIDMV